MYVYFPKKLPNFSTVVVSFIVLHFNQQRMRFPVALHPHQLEMVSLFKISLLNNFRFIEEL